MHVSYVLTIYIYIYIFFIFKTNSRLSNAGLRSERRRRSAGREERSRGRKQAGRSNVDGPYTDHRPVIFGNHDPGERRARLGNLRAARAGLVVGADRQTRVAVNVKPYVLLYSVLSFVFFFKFNLISFAHPVYNLMWNAFGQQWTNDMNAHGRARTCYYTIITIRMILFA